MTQLLLVVSHLGNTHTWDAHIYRYRHQNGRYDGGAEIISRQELYTKPWKVDCPNVMLCTRGLPRTLLTAFHHSGHGGMQGNFSFTMEVACCVQQSLLGIHLKD